MKITWWGHATATLTVGGVRVLTDPLLSDRLGHLRRQVASVRPAQACAADVAVVSHLHADHLHLPSLRQLPASTPILVPRGGLALIERRAPELAGQVRELGRRDTVDVAGLTITATPAHHDGRRLPGSPFRGPALGFVVRTPGQSVWFAGDTGLFEGLDGIGPVDVAVVPVGGWGPTLGPHHLDPEQAVRAVLRVGAAHAVPVHYGTYWPLGLRRAAPSVYRDKCLRPGDRFAAAAAGAPFTAHVVAPGSSVELG